MAVQQRQRPRWIDIQDVFEEMENEETERTFKVLTGQSEPPPSRTVKFPPASVKRRRASA